MEERGAGGGTVRLWSAVPSPGQQKSKKFNLNQGIAGILNFGKQIFKKQKLKETPHPSAFGCHLSPLGKAH